MWRFFNRNAVIIFMVHGVMDMEDSSDWVPLRPQLSLSRLENILQILSRYYHFVSLQEAVEMLSRQKPIKPYSLVLTFDDGCRNNIKYALPICRKFGVPITIYPATGNVENRKPFWFDRLDYAIQHADVDGREVRIGNEIICLSSNNRDSLRCSYKQLRNASKKLEQSDLKFQSEIEKLAAGFEAESGQSLGDIFETDNWSALLTWEEVRNAAQEGVCFGSHTVDHIRLDRVDVEMIRDQLARSKEMIEAHTGQLCDHLCYPNGSFNDQVVKIAHECGYKSAVTTVEGTNRLGDDLMKLRRIHIPIDGSATEMLALVCGISTVISRVKIKIRAALLSIKEFLFGNNLTRV